MDVHGHRGIDDTDGLDDTDADDDGVISMLMMILIQMPLVVMVTISCGAVAGDVDDQC